MAAPIHLVNLLHRRQRRPRKFRERKGFGDLREDEIINRYRLDRNTILHLVQLLNEDLSPDSYRGRPIDTLTQVLITLRFLAKGDIYSEIADCHGVSRSSVSRIIGRGIEAINRRIDNINFPTDEASLRKTKLDFYRKCKIPNVVGAVDCTLVPILAPARDENVYVCRKGFHAVNIQAVVDNTLKFVDVVAKWPGSVHDAAIFDSSQLKAHLETTGSGCLLGDSGYPLRTYLLTPVLNPSREAEEAYNSAHCQGRIVVERAFGVLKSRFRCLHKTGGCLMLKPDKACQTVMACIKLHNLCVDRKLDLNELVVEEPENNNNDRVFQPARPSGVQFRETVIRLFE